jgi:ribosome-associated protein
MILMTETDHEMTPPSPASEAPVKPEPKRRRSQLDMQDVIPANAAARTSPERLTRALEHARACARIADDNRGRDILLLDVRNATPLMDYLVIATATSRRQSHAIAIEVDQEMKRLNELKLGMEGSEDGRWILIDYGDFVVHVLSTEARAYYALEEIWGDAVRLDWQDPDSPKPPIAE